MAARRGVEEYTLVPRNIEQRREELRRASAVPRGMPQEMKYYVVSNNSGVLSQNTWGQLVASGSGVWNGITQGTDQNQRIGRRIRVFRYRFVFAPSTMAYDTLVGAFTLTRTDSNIASSDLFVSSGTTRSAFDYPNPVGQSGVHSHTLGTAMQLAGAAAGTTPSYTRVVIVHDVEFKKGRLVSYDASGATGPLLCTYLNVSETALTCDYFVQVWFQDA